MPSAPFNVTIDIFDSTSVTLKWGPPLSPNGIVLYYKVTFYGYKEESKVQDPCPYALVTFPLITYIIYSFFARMEKYWIRPVQLQ